MSLYWAQCLARSGRRQLVPGSEIRRADFEALVGAPGWTFFLGVQEGLRALGFGGAFTALHPGL
ncbi:hypothetical protein [Streptomyces sp. NPDC047046]|uniref:hypothetical protein n=1 Tax=Streptomyces sp. NPDC047046 TaxID=3155378 RepID=UPI0033CD2E80